MRIFCSLIVIFIFTTSSAHSDDLDVDLSRPDVQLNVSFKGSELLIFGAKDLQGDVIIVVRGPTKDTSVRLKQKIMGVWANTDEVVFADAPSYYALAATQPISELLSAKDLKTERIGTHNLGLNTIKKPKGATAKIVQDFTDGLIRNMKAKSLYTKETGIVRRVGRQLFRTNLWFPSNVSVGDYTVDTFLVVDKKIESRKTTHLQVHKVGFEAKVFNFAHEHAMLYGLLAIVIAVISGWVANVVFKTEGQ